MEQEKKLTQFYGGVIGPWIPMITMTTNPPAGICSKALICTSLLLLLGSLRRGIRKRMFPYAAAASL